MTLGSRIGALTVSLTCLLAIACGPGTAPLVPVKGRVLFQGRPLPYGTIVFVPDSTRGTQGNIAMADIQADGTFTLKTNDVAGAVVGHHKVTVSAIYPGPIPQSAIPPKYRDPYQSGLTCEVIAGKPNTFDINLN